MRIIKEKEVEKNINLQKAFELIEKSYLDYSAGRTVAAVTTSMEVNDGMFYSFPAFIKGKSFFISKQASDFRNNKKYNLPSVHPYILVFNSKTGILESIIEGRLFAAVRTSLSSAIGVKHFSKQPKKIAILGSGVQGEFHAKIFSELFNSIKEIAVYSPTKSHRDNLVKKLNKTIKRVKVVASLTAKEAVNNADVVVCATSSKTPVFEDQDLKKQVLIIGVGAMKNDQEIPTQTIKEAIIIVDTEKNIDKYDELTKPMQEGYKLKIKGEIGRAVLQKIKLNNQKIVFKHHGLPVTDAALAET